MILTPWRPQEARHHWRWRLRQDQSSQCLHPGLLPNSKFSPNPRRRLPANSALFQHYVSPARAEPSPPRRAVRPQPIPIPFLHRPLTGTPPIDPDRLRKLRDRLPGGRKVCPARPLGHGWAGRLREVTAASIRQGPRYLDRILGRNPRFAGQCQAQGAYTRSWPSWGPLAPSSPLPTRERRSQSPSFPWMWTTSSLPCATPCPTTSSIFPPGPATGNAHPGHALLEWNERLTFHT